MEPFVRKNFYDQSIDRMWMKVLEMGSNVELLLEESLQAIINQDVDRMNKILELEDLIDRAEEEIEMEALELISLQQPLPEDLRKLAAFMKIIKDLERVGDLGINIGQAAVRLSDLGEYFKPLIDIPKMAKMSQDMICKALHAYKEQDIILAEETCKMDQKIDEIYLDLQEELIGYMEEDVKNIKQASQFLLIAKDLERIGDHAENIAEMVNFMVTGKKKIDK